MFLIVGLGNPGTDYARHRHNIGFMALDAVAKTYSFSGWRKRFLSETAEGLIQDKKVFALRPQTYMNLSGQAVMQAAEFYKVSPSHIIVFHDDLDLLPGDVRVKKGGSAGGHNGLKSLDQYLGQDYWRVRIGIGRPVHKSQVSSYVLQNFDVEEETWMHPLLRDLADNLPWLLSGHPDKFLAALKLRG